MRAAHTAILGVAALALAACGDPRRGEVLVHWTFAGGQTCQQAGVNVIQVDIAGQILTPNQYFCTDPRDGSLRIGADLGSYFFSTYTMTLTGFDVDGTTIFQGSQTFTVNGDVDVSIDLQRTASTFATADVSWDPLNSTGGFVPGANGAMTCSEAQVDTVRIFVDGVDTGDVACDTAGVEGALVEPLTAGNHSFVISAFRNVSGTATLVYQTSTAVSAPFQIGATTNVDVTADSVGSGIGSATLNWGTGCSGTVSYMLTSPNGTASSMVNGVSCTAPIPVSSVMAGLWRVDATSGMQAAHVLFGVPNQSSASWTINFSP